MPDFLRYRPVPLSLAPESPVVRDLLDRRIRTDGRGTLGASDRVEYDARSLFHDVFLADGALWMIGPPLVNLARALGALRVGVAAPGEPQARPLRVHRRDHPRASVWRTPLPRALRALDALEVQLRFAAGPALDTVARALTLPIVPLQFATLQKDNEPAWIVDWLLHARRLGATRVLLYDNASADADGLAAALADRVRDDRAMPDIVFVDWPWPYGTRRNHANKFTRATHANHVHRRFAQAQWTGHFDIDEYPVHGVGEGAPGSLVPLLREQPSRIGAVRIDSWWVPAMRVRPVPGTLAGGATSAFGPRSWSARDFPLREPAPRGVARKLFVRGRAVSDMRTHSVRLRPGWWRRTLASDRIGFLHYKALTTGWKTHEDRFGRVASPDPSSLVEDRRVIESLAASDAARGHAGVAARRTGT